MKRSLSLILVTVMLLILLSACSEIANNNEPIYSDQSVLSNTTDISECETATSESTNDSTDSSNILIEKSTTPELSAEDSQTSKSNSSGSTAESQTSKPSSSGSSSESSSTSIPSSEENTIINDISITVGKSVFFAKLYDNNAAKALLTQLPMSINMSELNGNEKYYYLSGDLPMNSGCVENIQAGDLMLYGSNCLVLFYENFQSSYSYTKLGYIENTSGLVAALGSGSVQISFAVRDKN